MVALELLEAAPEGLKVLGRALHYPGLFHLGRFDPCEVGLELGDLGFVRLVQAAQLGLLRLQRALVLFGAALAGLGPLRVLPGSRDGLLALGGLGPGRRQLRLQSVDVRVRRRQPAPHFVELQRGRLAARGQPPHVLL